MRIGPVISKSAVVVEDMAKHCMYRHKEGTNSYGCEVVDTPIRRHEQGTEEIRNKYISTRGSQQVPDQSIPRGVAHLVGHRPLLGRIRVSASEAGANKSQGDSNTRVSRFKLVHDKAAGACSRLAEPCPRTAVVKGMKAAAYDATEGINRETKNRVLSGVGTVNRRKAVIQLGDANQSATRKPVREPEENEFIVKALERTRRMQEAQGIVLGTKQEELGVPLDCRVRKKSYALWLTGENGQQARGPAHAESVTGEVAVKAKLPTRLSASRGHSVARTQTGPSSNLTTAAFLEPRGIERVHQHSASGSNLCQHSSGFVCRSTSPHESDFPLTTATDNRDAAVVRGSASTLLPEVYPLITPKQYSVGGGDSVHEVFGKQPLSAAMLPLSTPLPSTNEGLIVQGKRAACKPFPERDTLIEGETSLRPCSSAAFGEKEAVPTTPFNNKHVKPRTELESHKHSGCLPPCRPLRVRNCTDVCEGARDEQRLRSAEVTKAAATREKCEALQTRKIAQVKEQLRTVGLHAFQLAPTAATRTVNCSMSAKPAASTCITKNQASYETHAVPTFKSIRFLERVLQARIPPVNPHQMMNSLKYREPSHCLLQTKTGSPSNHETRAVAKRPQPQKTRNSKASTRGRVASRAAKRLGAANEANLSQLQQQRQQVAPLWSDAWPVSNPETKTLSSLTLAGSATLYKCARLALRCREDGGNKLPSAGKQGVTGVQHAYTNVAKGGAANGKLPKLDVVARPETRFNPKFMRRLEDKQRCSASKQGQRPLTLKKLPSDKPLKRYPHVPALPLHLLPEILARKDAEEVGFKRQRGQFFHEHGGEGLELSVQSQHQHSALTQYQDKSVSDFTEGDVHSLNESLSTFETRNPSPVDKLIVPKHSVDEKVSPGLSARTRVPHNSTPFRDLSINPVGGKSCVPRLPLPHEYLSKAPARLYSQANPRIKALEAAVEAGTQRQLQCSVPNALPSVCFEATQMMTDFRPNRMLLEKEAYQRSSPDVSRGPRQALSQTKSQPKHKALPPLQLPRFTSGTHARVAGAQSGDVAKQGQRGCGSSDVRALSLAGSHQQRLQWVVPKSQPRREPQTPQRLMPKSQPVRVKTQQWSQRDSLNALTAGGNTAVCNKHRALLGQNQAIKGSFNPPRERKEDETLPRIRSCAQKENGSQVLPCVRNAKERSGSQKWQQSTISESSVERCKGSPRPINKRPVHNCLKRPPINPAPKPLSTGEIGSSCVTRLLLPLKNKLHGIRQEQDSQRQCAQTMQPTVFRAPSTLCVVDGATDQQGEGAAYSGKRRRH